MSLIAPNTLTVLGTYKCTAACKECCFECGPHLNQRVLLEDIIAFIKEGKETFETLRGVVFSGGECFLLGNDLVEAVKCASSLGLNTRCVSNGYWASTIQAAKRRIEPLRNAGLKELNFSTGNDHQEFVPFDNIVNGAIQAARFGIKVIIVVEGFENSTFKYEDAVNHPVLKNFMSRDQHRHNIRIINNVWVPFFKEREIVPLDVAKRNYKSMDFFEGCDNILTNLALTPNLQLASCCGITMEHIREMKIGEFKSESLKELYNKQFEDFLKLWIWVDGPERIYHFATTKEPTLGFDGTITHNCQACAVIYGNESVKEVISKYWSEIKDEVLFRYYVKRKYYLQAVKIS
ncbi:radical SAM protein [Paenibacillus polymyxa]|nr:radical SAM protein [Paenibacillus polymyxa]